MLNGMSDNLSVITENMGKAGQIGYCTYKPEHFCHLGWLQSVQIIHDNNKLQIQTDQLLCNFSPKLCRGFLINSQTAV
ncbi:Uncharacterised protein [Enterobacter hormaechei]|nr:Uncharacterised protein [Enterobacter hormaechei]SAE34513.1 Uncharacterised protein [Enterobacter hormaechei]